VRNIKLTISYDGTAYAGWQSQKNARGVQHVIEAALKKITGRAAKLKASGRTDAGVHARRQTANFRTVSGLALARLVTALNSEIPDDILVTRAEEASLGFDSQKCAKSKRYRYTVSTARFTDPFLRHFVARFSYELDINSMRRAASALAGRHDFSAFRASGSKEGRSIRTIKRIKIVKNGSLVYIDISADGFLYNMARTICGTLLEIGRGRLPETRTAEILKTKDRRLAGPTAPAKGLCLMDVVY
jgi:tRNA pseudouridine38-40 synthase